MESCQDLGVCLFHCSWDERQSEGLHELAPVTGPSLLSPSGLAPATFSQCQVGGYVPPSNLADTTRPSTSSRRVVIRHLQWRRLPTGSQDEKSPLTGLCLVPGEWEAPAPFIAIFQVTMNKHIQSPCEDKASCFPSTCWLEPFSESHSILI